MCHSGQHQPIVDRELWDQVQQQLHEHAMRRRLRAVKVEPSPLAGKLFDPSGAGLTPSHARKGERRYRYYISRGLTIGPAHRVRDGWRLPAPEIERTVAAAAQQLLTDEPAIATAVEDAGVAANRIPSILETTRAWSGKLRSRAWCSAAARARRETRRPESAAALTDLTLQTLWKRLSSSRIASLSTSARPGPSRPHRGPYDRRRSAQSSPCATGVSRCFHKFPDRCR